MDGLNEQVALVTGASRGVGRSVAIGLAAAGVRVFATGRTIANANLASAIHAISCDHTDDRAVADVFRHIHDTAGRFDILVNVAWGGYERMVEDGDPDVSRRTGSVLIAAALAEEYGFTDTDGRRLRPLTLGPHRS